MVQVKKRNGNCVPFNKQKILNAINKSGTIRQTTVHKIANAIESELSDRELPVDIEEIQDMVEEHLMKTSYVKEAREYIRYRKEKDMMRKGSYTFSSILDLIDNKNEYLKTENSNKNISIASTQRDYMAGEVSKAICRSLLFPKDLMELHDHGVIHIHDLDYEVQHIFNCALLNLDDMLQNGTVINGTKVEKPHSFTTACTIATQIAAIIASNQYGGQTMSLTHLAPFVDVSRQKIIGDLKTELAMCGTSVSEEVFDKIVARRLKDEISKGVQTLQYQINTIMSTNGQTPFITLFMYLNEAKDAQTKADLAMVIEEVLRQRIQGVKNEVGAWVTPAFPKLIYVLEEDNIRESSEYWNLTVLSAQCTAKRLVPDYISEKKMIELKGYCFPSMGCRSFLSPWMDAEGNPKFYGRFNQGVVTVNLPYVALEAVKKSGDCADTESVVTNFFALFDEYLEKCHEALQIRHRRLLNTDSGTSPLHWRHGALARLEKGETINKLLFDGYSTISLGYAGLYECVMALCGESHSSEKGKTLAVQILTKMNDKCEVWKSEENIGYSVYGTPIESTTYKFAKALKKDFGEIKDVSDHDYITNSYHVNVREAIDPFTKLKLESDFQKLSQGGCISYIECADLQNNISAVIKVMQFIYDNIMYAELNTKSDYCQVCGYDGEIEICEEGKKLIWRCPNCGNTDQGKMNVARRTCGYIGANFWNQGRTEEIRDRWVHLGAVQEVELCES